MTAISVSQVNQYIKQLLDCDDVLGQIAVSGEISNYKKYPSGHHYFTLKDAEGSLKCVMFRSAAQRLRFLPKDGLGVIAHGRITVYPRDGVYQLYCEALLPGGTGDLHAAYEQLKEKLQAQGLFDLSHKRPLPAYPHRIALVTSSAGAAVRDMLRILGCRYPLSEVYLLPVRVQGQEATGEIVQAIRYANDEKLADVIITGRGGGSIEDLWAFNDEQVARTIFDSQIPVVSAVGHEPDVTISDFVADLRAATPSNAAELVAPDRSELCQHLDALQGRMAAALARTIHFQRQRLQGLAASSVLRSPGMQVDRRRVSLNNLHRELILQMKRSMDHRCADLSRLSAALDAMSPLKVLGRGYGVIRDGSGELIRSVTQTRPGQPILVQLADGSIQASITAVQEDAP